MSFANRGGEVLKNTGPVTRQLVEEEEEEEEDREWIWNVNKLRMYGYKKYRTVKVGRK